MAATTKRKSPRKAAVRKRRSRSKTKAAARPRRQTDERKRAQGTTRRAAAPHPPLDADRYPNLAALEAWDREMHIRSAMGMGLTREEAERHVEEELADGHLA